MDLSLITIFILDNNPIHLEAFDALALACDFIRIVICNSVEHAAGQTTCPDLLLIHLSHDTECSNFVLHQALSAFSETLIICYSAGFWVGRKKFSNYRERLMALTYEEVLEILRDYVAIRRGIELSMPGISEHRMAQMDDELEHVLTRLTPKERDVLCLLGKGHGSPEIAEIMNRKPNTIDSHLKNIRGKLQFKGMTELRSLAIRIAQSGSCHVFSRYDSHICPHLGGASVGCCPLHADE